MPAFNAYDYVAYIVPGAVLLIGLMLLFPAVKKEFAGNKLDLSDLGILIILSFAFGQVLHQLGHIIDNTSFARTHYIDTIFCKDSVLSTGEQGRLPDAIKRQFDAVIFCPSGEQAVERQEVPKEKESHAENNQTKEEKFQRELCTAQFDLAPLCLITQFDQAAWSADKEKRKDAEKKWHNAVARIYIDVFQAKMNERVDIFDRGIGLLLALGTVFAVLFCVCLVIVIGPHLGFKSIKSTLHAATRDEAILAALLLVALGVASYISFARMQYFAMYYASELFLTYLEQGANGPLL